MQKPSLADKLIAEVFYPEESERIKNTFEKNNLTEDEMKKKIDNWTEKIDPLFQSLQGFQKLYPRLLRGESLPPDVLSDIVDVQSYALAYRQQLNDEITRKLFERSKIEAINKTINTKKILFYSTISLKTNSSEKMNLIEGHLAQNVRQMELRDIYIEFLRSTSKNLESLSFTIKNTIDLMNILSKI